MYYYFVDVCDIVMNAFKLLQLNNASEAHS